MSRRVEKFCAGLSITRTADKNRQKGSTCVEILLTFAENLKKHVMASLRKLKKDIDYLMDEVVTDSYLSLYFHPENKDEIVKVIQDAVDLRNSLYDRANNPIEKKSTSLVHKHYAAVRRDMFEGIDGLFVRLSGIGK